MSIKGIMFDYGNVLSNPQQSADVEEMARSAAIPLERFKTLYWQFRDEYDLAELDGKGYWSKIAERAGVAFDGNLIEQLIDLDARSWSRPNMPMANWVDILRNHGFKAGVISNMPLELRHHIVRESWLPQFDHYTFSCDIRSVKPAADIYLHCVKGLNLEVTDLLFLDDRQINVDAANQLGIAGIVFTTPEALNFAIEIKGLPLVPTTV